MGWQASLQLGIYNVKAKCYNDCCLWAMLMKYILSIVSVSISVYVKCISIVSTYVCQMYASKMCLYCVFKCTIQYCVQFIVRSLYKGPPFAHTWCLELMKVIIHIITHIAQKKHKQYDFQPPSCNFRPLGRHIYTGNMIL